MTDEKAPVSVIDSAFWKPESGADVRDALVRIANGRKRFPNGRFGKLPREEMMNLAREACMSRGWRFDVEEI